MKPAKRQGNVWFVSYKKNFIPLNRLAYIGESLYVYDVKKAFLIAYHVVHLAGEFMLTDHDELRWLAAGEFDADTVKWPSVTVTLVEQYKAMKATGDYLQDSVLAHYGEARLLRDARKKWTNVLLQKVTLSQ